MADPDQHVAVLDPGVGDADGHLAGAGNGFVEIGETQPVVGGVMSEIPVEEYLCTQIRRTEQALMGHHEAVLRGYGLTMTQYTVLLALSREGGMSGAQLARACGVTQQTRAAVLTGLQNKHLILSTPRSASCWSGRPPSWPSRGRQAQHMRRRCGGSSQVRWYFMPMWEGRKPIFW